MSRLFFIGGQALCGNAGGCGVGSVHSAVARHSKFRTAVPRERILIESDHGLADPPEAIPCRIEWVEHLVAPQLGSQQKGCSMPCVAELIDDCKENKCA